jgi:hypothetical protein
MLPWALLWQTAIIDGSPEYFLLLQMLPEKKREYKKQRPRLKIGTKYQLDLRYDYYHQFTTHYRCN